MISTIMIFLAQDFYLLVLAGALALLVVRYRARWREIGIALAVIGGGAFGVAQVGARLIQDPRPFLVAGGSPLIPSAVDNGFPSDHTLLTATAAAVVTVVNPRAGVLFWGLAAVVGLARVYARVHHLLDVAGSLVIVGLALAGYLGLRQFWRGRRRSSARPPAPR